MSAVAERGDYVLSNCMVILQGDSGAPASASKPATATAAPAKPKPTAAPTPSAAAPAAAAAGGGGGKFAAEAIFAELKKSITPDVVKQVHFIWAVSRKESNVMLKCANLCFVVAGEWHIPFRSVEW